jgi:23S rRNA (cytidine1920-2'-O)/16S rRNA (cytidine1409-2'-O)-methyltransferase
LDVGCSTGGFTDCLIQNNSAKVYAMDTGYGVIDWKLRNHAKVVVMERTNILYIDHLPETLDLVVVDTSWTRLKLSVPAVTRFLKPVGIILALLKPQYEAPKSYLERGVVIPEKLGEVVETTRQELMNLGFMVSESFESPVIGTGGNREYWLHVIHSKSLA